MKFIIEIKNRLLLIVLNFSLLFNISYYYKNILLFFLVKQVATNQEINFYLIYTNISELLNIYFEIVYLFTVNLSSYFILYHILIFISYALHKNEYKLISLFFFNFTILNLILSLFVIMIIYPFIWEFFQYFQNSFVFNLLNFEIKIHEYYKTLLNVYIFSKYSAFTLIFSMLVFKNNIKIITLTKFRKINFIILLLILSTINDLFNQILICLLITFSYESVVLILIYIKYYK